MGIVIVTSAKIFLTQIIADNQASRSTSLSLLAKHRVTTVLICEKEVELIAIFKAAIETTSHKLDIVPIPRNYFNENKGRNQLKELLNQIHCPQSNLAYQQVSTKYAALSAFSAAQEYATKLGRSMQAKGLDYIEPSCFLSLDQQTCISLNIFGTQNSMIRLFEPITNMGKKLLKRRLNQPSASSRKIIKWH